MKKLVMRTINMNPYGQHLKFDDGTVEWDAECTQTTAILTAQARNGIAARDESGVWHPGRGPRIAYDYDLRLLGFAVSLTLVHVNDEGKACYDYACTTPTGALFYGDGDKNVLCVPSGWAEERVAAEVIAWICIGEDAGAEFGAELTPDQLTWLRSPNREAASLAIDEWLETYDRGGELEQMTRARARTSELAEMYLERDVLANQSGLIAEILQSGAIDDLSYDNIENLRPDTWGMSAEDAASYIENELGGDWHAIAEVDDDTDIDDLTDDQVARLTDYIDENCRDAEIYEWYLVSQWLHGQLHGLGECTLAYGTNYWWGRQATGQAILQDGILQHIAAQYV